MKLKLLLLSIFCTLPTLAQSLENLKLEASKVYDANYSMDFDAILKLSYPQIVTSIGSETMLAKLDSDYLNERYRMRIQLETHPVFQYSAIKKIDGKTICVITFKNPVRYFYEKKLDTDTAAQQAALLKESNNTREVTFEPKRNSFNVRRNSRFIAISDDTTQNQWKFFNLDDASQRQLFEALFADNVKKDLGL